MDATRPLRDIVLERANAIFMRSPLIVSTTMSLSLALMALLTSMTFVSKKTSATPIEESQAFSTVEKIKPDYGVYSDLENPSLTYTVDVAGAVVNPGVYKLKPNSRVSDAISSAGGLSSETDAFWFAAYINLARKVSDGEKVYVPYIWDIYRLEESVSLDNLLILETPQSTRSSKSHIGEKTLETEVSAESRATNGNEKNISNPQSLGVAINSASFSELDSLQGVGEVYANRIIDKRPFDNYEDMIARSGVPKATLEKLKGLLIFE